MGVIIDNHTETALLCRFNRRELSSFGEVYLLFYNELLHFALKLYDKTSIEASDVVQDVFINIWQTERVQFENLISIKAYLYISIKNNFKNHLQHLTSKEKYKKNILNNKNLFAVEIIESEVYSLLGQTANLLSEECIEVLRLHMEGWDVKEIALKLGKSERTVYNRKYEAIEIFKKTITNNAFLSLIL